LLEKVIALKTEKLDEGEELPYDLASKDEFLLSAQRFARIHISDAGAYLTPRSARAPRGEDGEDGAVYGSRPRRRRDGKPRSPPDGAKDGAGGGEGEGGPRRRRPMGTPQQSKEVTLSEDANDSTVIAHLVYKCASLSVRSRPCSEALRIRNALRHASQI
jgi:hypothetical protein